MDSQNLVIHKLFSETASRFPANVALQIKKDNYWQRFSFAELEKFSLKIATFLVREGFKKGECAALILENRPEWPIIYLGIMYAGLVCVPLDVQLNQEDLERFIADSRAKILFCSQAVFTKKITPSIQENLAKVIILDAEIPRLPKLVNFSDLEGIVPDKNILPLVSEEDIASLIYTSGTTGIPKGVLLTHKNICSNFRSLEELNICFNWDNLLSILPLHHTYAFMVTLIVPLFLGAKVTYFALGFKPQDLILTIKEAGVTVLVGVPQLFSLLHKAITEKTKKIPSIFMPIIQPFIKTKLRNYFGKSLRLLVSGGARLEPEIGQDLSRLGFKIVEGYGLTETSPVVTLNPPEKVKFGSVGRPIPEVQIKILNPDKSGIGQVLINGPNVMQGYFNQPDSTSQVIKDSWFYSGDLGFIDKDGYLFLTGREKDVIVLSSGKNIFPEELEEYYSHSPYIKEICILDRYEEKFGYGAVSLYAIVVPNLEYFRQKNETDIQGKIRWELENLGRNLPVYKHIMGFKVMKEELPRTALKKIKRYQVKQEYLPEKLVEKEVEEGVLWEDDAGISDKEIAKKVIEYISGQLKKPVNLTSHLELDLGIDSLSRVELGLGLEGMLSIKVPDEVLYSCFTVKELIIRIQDILDKTGPIKEKIPEPPKSWFQILQEPLGEEIARKIRIESSFLENLLTWLFKILFLFIFRIFWLLRLKGKTNLPSRGPYIICPNHASYLDAFVVFSSLNLSSSKNVFFIGHNAIFEHPLISWSIRLARLISIDPATHLTEAMQAANFVLSQKKIVCVFPEGRRSIDENVQEFKKGTGILIKESNARVVPVYIKGSHQSWPRGHRLPRFYPLEVIFGRPFSAEELIKEGRRMLPTAEDYEAVALGLREEVIKLKC